MEELEDVLDDVLGNEPSFTELELSFALIQQAPFCFELYQQRLGGGGGDPDRDDHVSDAQWETFLLRLVQAIGENETVTHARLDWHFLRILTHTERQTVLESIGGLPKLTHIAISVPEESPASTSTMTYFDPSLHQISSQMLTRMLQRVPEHRLVSLFVSDDGHITVSNENDIQVLNLALLRQRTTLQRLSIHSLYFLDQPANSRSRNRLQSTVGSSFISESSTFMDISLEFCLFFVHLEHLELGIELPRSRRLTRPAVTQWELVLPTLLRDRQLRTLSLVNFGLDAAFVALLHQLLVHQSSSKPMTLSLTSISLVNNRDLSRPMSPPLDHIVLELAREVATLTHFDGVALSDRQSEGNLKVQLWLNQCRLSSRLQSRMIAVPNSGSHEEDEALLVADGDNDSKPSMLPLYWEHLGRRPLSLDRNYGNPAYDISLTAIFRSVQSNLSLFE